MSKTERRKFFQPIPLSTILDPRYQTPFSKLQQFQVDVDMDISKGHSPQVQGQSQHSSVWKKLQSTLVTAMSNLVVISHPVFASTQTSATFVSTSTRSSAATSLSIFSSWPCKSFSSNNNNNNKNCEISNEDFLLPVSNSSSSSLKSDSSENSNSNLYHSVRSGLECLRYLATHPLYHCNHNHRNHQEIEDRKLINSTINSSTKNQFPVLGFSLGSSAPGSCGTLFFPIPFQTCKNSFASSTSTSLQSSPVRQRSASVNLPNLFTLAFRGIVLFEEDEDQDRGGGQGQEGHQLFYKGSYFFLPTAVMFMKKSQSQGQGASYPGVMREVMSEPTTPHKFATPSSCDMFLQAAAARLTLEPFGKRKSQESSSSSPSPSCLSPPIDINAPPRARSQSSGSGGGCFRIESGTVTINMSGSPGKSGGGGGCGFGGARGGGGFGAARRMKTESESSTDSFIEFSASVESTDSFCIVFEASGGAGGGGAGTGEQVDEDDLWDEEDEEEDDDDEDEDEDQVLSYQCEVFETEGIFEDEVDLSKQGASANGVKKEVAPRKKNKKGMMVSFDEDHLVTRVEFEDDPASKDSREPYWEIFARDRSRFDDRIKRTGHILYNILRPGYRSRIYRERFSADN